jgi:hypothetical protein
MAIFLTTAAFAVVTVILAVTTVRPRPRRVEAVAPGKLKR